MRTIDLSEKTKKVLALGGLAALATALGCHGPAAPAGALTIGTAPASSASGTSVLLGSLAEARVLHAVAPISSEKVLVAGGQTTDAAATDTAEVVDAASGKTEALAARLATKRAGARAVRLADGRVLVLGGHGLDGKALATTELFDPLAREFHAGPALAAPRDSASLVQVGAKLFVLGGKGEKSVEVLELSPLAAGRKLQGSLAGEHVLGQAALVGGSALLAGGFCADAPELFDLSTETASPLARPAGEWTGETLVAQAGRAVLVGGGEAGQGTAARATELQGHAFVVTHTVGLARRFGSSVAFAGGVIVLGGQGSEGGAFLGETDLVAATGPSVSGPSLHLGRIAPGLARLDDGRVVVVGGLDSKNAPSNVCEVLVPAHGAAPDPRAAFGEAESVARAEKAVADARDRATLRAQDDEVKLADTQKTLLSTETQLTRTTADLAAEKLALAGANAQIGADRSALAQANQSLASTQGQLAKANAQASSLQASLAAANGQVSQLQGQVAQLGAQSSSLRAQAASAAAAPPVAPVAPAAPRIPGALTPSGSLTIYYSAPAAARPGQIVQMTVSPGTASIFTTPLQVYFSGVQGQIAGRPVFTGVSGIQQGEVDVLVPSLPAGHYDIQLVCGASISNPRGLEIAP